MHGAATNIIYHENSLNGFNCIVVLLRMTNFA